MSSFAAALQEVLAVLDRLEIPFLIGGSIASSMHGLPRQTNDVDIIADLTKDSAAEFCTALGAGFHTDLETAIRAIQLERPFNVIHLQTAYKFDIFPVGQNRFARSELARRVLAKPGIAGLETIELPLASPEDTLLAKLVWFRHGGEASDRQWRDVLGVIQIQAERLDTTYLEKWAAELGVADLLWRALSVQT